MLAALLLALIPAAARARLADGAARLLRGWGLLIMPMLGWLALYAAFPEHEETHALFDDGPSHLHYLMVFGVGWLLRVRPLLFESVPRVWHGSAVLEVSACRLIAGVDWNWTADMRPPYGALLRSHFPRPVHG